MAALRPSGQDSGAPQSVGLGGFAVWGVDVHADYAAIPIDEIEQRDRVGWALIPQSSNSEFSRSSNKEKGIYAQISSFSAAC
jgi:hypothetical protein